MAQVSRKTKVLLLGGGLLALVLGGVFYLRQGKPEGRERTLAELQSLYLKRAALAENLLAIKSLASVRPSLTVRSSQTDFDDWDREQETISGKIAEKLVTQESAKFIPQFDKIEEQIRRVRQVDDQWAMKLKGPAFKAQALIRPKE